METQIPNLCSGNVKRCEPSYEGWKQFSLSVQRLCFQRCEPSYEGWKQETLLDADNLGFSCEPSYEGWKRGGGGGQNRRERVVSLPTRDGNLF